MTASPALSYDYAPRVLIVTDAPDLADILAGEVAAAGANVMRVVTPADAMTVLDEISAIDLLFADLSADDEALDPLLSRLRAAAGDETFRSLVAVSLPLVDRATGLAWYRGVELLCEAPAWQRADTLARMVAECGPVRPALAERDPDPGHIRQLRAEVQRISRTLEMLSGEGVQPILPEGERDPAGAPAGADLVPPDPAAVRTAIRARRLRDQFFDPTLFADPAWDMLLDLLVARLETRQVAVSSLCIASAVPATTALRWIKTLTEAGLFLRAADPRDGRRVFIDLSDQAFAGLCRYFEALRRHGLVAA